MKDYVNVHFYKTLKVTKLVSTASQSVVCFFCLFAVSKYGRKSQWEVSVETCSQTLRVSLISCMDVRPGEKLRGIKGLIT